MFHQLCLMPLWRAKVRKAIWTFKNIENVIFVFGEKSAQTLLNSQAPLDSLRGKAHQYEGVDLIASYAPGHLLTQTQDKAKAWADLCLARDTVQAMK